ncbi:MAG: DUF6282 family protein, partial [Solirubrobacteraceae bacterium]
GGAVAVDGSLTLNQHAGGLSVAAVAAALAMGARVIWMPTADAVAQRVAGLPRLSDRHPELEATAYAIPPVDWSTEAAVRRIVALVAEYDAVLATGHLGAAEISWLLPVARTAGVRRLLLTHPSWTIPALTVAETTALTELGALAEVTAYQLLHQPGMDASALAAFVRAVGCERIVLSSDGGQPDSPAPPEALARLVDALIGQGLDRGAVLACASETPERLVTR